MYNLHEKISLVDLEMWMMLAFFQRGCNGLLALVLVYDWDSIISSQFFELLQLGAFLQVWTLVFVSYWSLKWLCSLVAMTSAAARSHATELLEYVF